MEGTIRALSLKPEHLAHAEKLRVRIVSELNKQQHKCEKEYTASLTHTHDEITTLSWHSIVLPWYPLSCTTLIGVSSAIFIGSAPGYSTASLRCSLWCSRSYACGRTTPPRLGFYRLRYHAQHQRPIRSSSSSLRPYHLRRDRRD